MLKRSGIDDKNKVKSNLAFVKLLLRRGADVNAENGVWLYRADDYHV